MAERSLQRGAPRHDGGRLMSTVITLCSDFHPTRQFAEFYCDGDGHAWVGTVTCLMPDGDRSLHIYCDGQMRAYECGPHADNSRIWNSSELSSRGIDTDEKLSDALDESRLDIQNNPWFCVYDDNSDLAIHDPLHSVKDAVMAAIRQVYDIKN